MSWLLSSSSAKDALAVVDGLGKFRRFGPHYSRRTPGSKTFTGCGQEIVLLHHTGRAVWAVIEASPPRFRRARAKSRCPLRLVFSGRSQATERTYEEWLRKYGVLPPERLRAEIGIKEVKSADPGKCYRLAGWS